MKILLVKLYQMIKDLFCDVIFWIIAAAVIIAVAGMTASVMKTYGYQICGMDFFPYVSKNQGFALLPVTICIVMAALRYEFRGERVVKFKKLGHVWGWFFVKIMLLSFACAILYTLALGLLGKGYKTFLWDRRDSLMFYYTAHVMPAYSYWKVVGEFLWVSFLNIWLFGGLAALLFWITRRFVAGILISVTLAAVLDTFRIDFYKRMCLSYEEICWNTQPQWRVAVYFPLLALIFAAGLILVRKRDFLKNEK